MFTIIYKLNILLFLILPFIIGEDIESIIINNNNKNKEISDIEIIEIETFSTKNNQNEYKLKKILINNSPLNFCNKKYNFSKTKEDDISSIKELGDNINCKKC